MATVQFENPDTGATIELTNPELGELVIDDETGVEYEVVSIDPPRLVPPLDVVDLVEIPLGGRPAHRVGDLARGAGSALRPYIRVLPIGLFEHHATILALGRKPASAKPRRHRWR